MSENKTEKKSRKISILNIGDVKDKIIEATHLTEINMDEDETVDFKKYNLNYDSLFSVKEMEETLINFLKKESAMEMYDFLKEIEALFEISDEIELEKKINQIISDYIKEDCTKSLNLPGKLKNDFIENYKKCMKLQIEVDLEKLFYDIKKLVFFILKNKGFV